MDAPARTHPAIVIAAITVTLTALTAMGSLLGLLPAQAAPSPAAPLVEQGAGPTARPTGAGDALTTPVTAGKPVHVSAVAGTAAAKRPAARATERAAEQAAPEAVVTPAPVAASRTGNANLQAATPTPTPTPAPAPAPACSDCAVVTHVRDISRDGEGSGLGAVAGGVVGGIVGNRFGKGSGRDLLTVLGAAGGAFAGHQIEKSQRRSAVQEVTVRFEDGHTQVLTEDTPRWNEGDHVRIRDERIAAL